MKFLPVQILHSSREPNTEFKNPVKRLNSQKSDRRGGRNGQGLAFYGRADTVNSCESSQQNPLPGQGFKLYNVMIRYPELTKALEEDPDWREETDPQYDHLLDLKFAFAQSDINFKNMKKGCWVNQNPGEAALTTKTELTQNLTNTHHQISSVYPMVTSDPKGKGVASFFPRCHLLKSGEGCEDFLRDYYFT